MKRKITSLLLALVMTLALAVPAFAAETYYDAGSFAAPDQNTSTMVFAATTRVPVISLALPQLAANPVVFNPYQISYTSDTDTLNGHAVANPSSGTNADQTKQIISPIYDIQNLSDTQLTVGVKATTTVEGNLALVSTDPTSDTKNSANIRVDFLTTKDNVNLSAVAWLKNDAEQKLFSAKDTVDSAISSDSNMTGKIVSNVSLQLDSKKAQEIKVTDTNNLVLPKTAGGDDATKAGHLLFQFAGSAAKNPSVAWTSGDKFTTTLVFTFQPGVAPAPADVTLAAADTTGSYTVASWNKTTGDNITFTVELPTGATAPTIKDSTSNTANKGKFTAADDVNVTASALSGTTTTITIDKTTLATAAASATNGTVGFTLGYTASDSTAKSVTFTVTLTAIA